MDDQKKLITKQIADRIREFRHTKSLSQEDLAFRANLNPAYFGQVERGIKCPTIDTLYKIAKALEVPLSELVQINPDNTTFKDYSKNINELLDKIPTEKHEQIFILFKDIASMF